MTSGPAIALIDGVHHPAAVRDALDRVERERGLAGVVFCGGEEKVTPDMLASPERHWGRPVVAGDPDEALRRLAAGSLASVVVDLADEPVLPPPAKLRLAARALHLGLAYEAPGTRLTPPRYEPVPFDGPKLAVIATGKRTGKTAVAGHWAALLRERGADPVVVSMGRGGPPQPELAEAGITIDELVELAEAGRHAASDYLEQAAIAGVRAVGCRRVGGGLAGEAYESNVPEGAELAASLRPGAIVFEGSGSTVPPVEVDHTVCIVGQEPDALGALGLYRLWRAELALLMELGGEGPERGPELGETPAIRCTLRPEPAEPLPDGARVAVFSTGADVCAEVEPVVASQALSNREQLERDLERAASEGCDVYLTELKAAAIDTVARRARERGARVVLVRNRPVGIDGDLDAALLGLSRHAGTS
jgi:cyclic 2,3-diphosphoglycerate synthetase